MDVRFIEPGDPTWSRLLAQADHDLYHLPEYVTIAAQHEGGSPCAAVVRDGHDALMLPLVVRPVAVAGCSLVQDCFDAVSPYGYPHPLLIPSADPPSTAFVRAALVELSEALRERHIITAFVRLHPLLPFPVTEAAAFGPIVEHGQTIAIDLEQGAPEILAGMRENHARWIRRGLQNEHRFCLADSPADVAEFVDIYTENMAYVGASSYYFFSLEYFQTLVERMPGQIRLAFLEIDGERACGMVFSQVGGIVEYHLGGTRSRFRRQSPMVLLTFKVALWAQDRGDRILHLGGGVGGGTDSLFRFKAGFSPLRYPYRTWRIISDAAAYAELTRTWEANAGVEADSPTGFFPAYRRPLSQIAETGYP